MAGCGLVWQTSLDMANVKNNLIMSKVNRCLIATKQKLTIFFCVLNN